VLADIGSGGGFPAVPIAIALPGLKLRLYERNEKKAGFLHKVFTALKRAGVQIATESFPPEELPTGPLIVTARGVERPEAVAPAIGRLLDAHSIYLCQSDRSAQWFRAKGFHVEPIQDEASRKGWRRGQLHRIRTSGAMR
jgi:16S rRNA G527 N7-methylase RsmG